MPNILIVEDNADIAMLYQRALMKYHNTVVERAEDAIELLNRQPYDLVILDLHLPEASGFTVLEHLRQERKDMETKIIVISADDMHKKRCQKYHIQDWMTKPIELDVFMEMVDRHLVNTPSPKHSTLDN
jgi:DNA-binding response OmpR family regulator